MGTVAEMLRKRRAAGHAQSHLADAPFGAGERKKLLALLPHLQHATAVNFQLAARDRRLNVTQAAVDLFCDALFFADRSGRVIHTNQAAKKLLADRDGLRLRNHRLAALKAAGHEYVPVRVVRDRVGTDIGKPARSANTSAWRDEDPAGNYWPSSIHPQHIFGDEAVFSPPHPDDVATMQARLASLERDLDLLANQSVGLENQLDEISVRMAEEAENLGLLRGSTSQWVHGRLYR